MCPLENSSEQQFFEIILQFSRKKERSCNLYFYKYDVLATTTWTSLVNSLNKLSRSSVLDIFNFPLGRGLLRYAYAMESRGAKLVGGSKGDLNN